MKIVLQHLTKKFPARGPVRGRKNSEDVIAVNDFDFEIPDGKLIGLLGPSGCGKSTALNLICGLLKPTEGKIFFGEDDVTGLPPENRGVGMVFQNYALYPHLTVEKNIQFPLENLKGADKLSKEEMSKRVLEAAKLVQIDHLLERKPNELSGGQQQRVAIARTLAPEPAVLFMDEPLSNLDAKLRLEMRYELQRLHVETGSTFVYVTHDQMEAMTLATKICLINNGVLQQYDAPLDVYNRPANLFVADFVGNPSINFVEAKGKEQADGSFSFRILDDLEATFRPNEPIDMAAWFAKRDKDAADLEAQRIEMLKDKKAVANWIRGEVLAKLNAAELTIEESPVSAEQVGQILNRMSDGTLNQKGARTVFSAIWEKKGDNVDALIETLGLKQISDTGAIEAAIDAVLAANPKMVAEFKSGKEKAFNALVGQTMRATKGKANPAQVNEILRAKLAQ